MGATTGVVGRCVVIGWAKKERDVAKEVMRVFRISVLPEVESDLSVCIAFFVKTQRGFLDN